MNEINKFFMAILITKDTPEQEVIDKILKHLMSKPIQSLIWKSTLITARCLILKFLNNPIEKATRICDPRSLFLMYYIFDSSNML